MIKYDIIYADPAWVYKDKAKAGKRGAESKYRCTPTEEMGRLILPVADNAVCAMWCTNPMIEEGLKLLNLWGFKYKTILFHWVKTNKDGTVFMGMGNHTRANAEICMLGVRGKGIKRHNASIYSTQLLPREEHSKKPDKFRTDIEKLWGWGCPKLELFAREKYLGWRSWGDEIESDIEIETVPIKTHDEMINEALFGPKDLTHFEHVFLNSLCRVLTERKQLTEKQIDILIEIRESHGIV